MNVISGIATASGVSSFLVAPRARGAVSETALGQPLTAEAQAGPRRPAPARGDTARPVAPPGFEEGAVPPGTQMHADSRVARFVEAVRALRQGSEPPAPGSERLAELREDGVVAFMLGDGTPREVEPLQPKPRPVPEPA